MKLFGNRRAIYVVSGALLTTLVVTSGSILTYLLVSPEIEKGKDKNNLDLARNALRALGTNIRELLARGPNATSIFRITLSKGILTANPATDQLSYAVATRISYDPGSTSSLSVSRGQNILTMTSDLPIDLVTKNTKIKPGSYIVTLTFEKEAFFRLGKWTLLKGAVIPGTVNSTTKSYYVSDLNESIYGVDVNRDGDTADCWILYLSDPSEEYAFDTVAIHDSHGTLIKVLKEGDAFKLNGVPFMVYRVKERYVVFRYARIRMEVR